MVEAPPLRVPSGYPKAWPEFTSSFGKRSLENQSEVDGSFKSGTSVRAVYRVANRYRAAKLFESCKFSGLGEDTADGYGALVRHFLCHSAAEELQGMLSDEQMFRRIASLVGQHGRFAAKLSKHNEQSISLFRGVAALTDRKHRSKKACMAALRYSEGGEPDHWLLSVALRNMFAHGRLTPNNEIYAQQTARIADVFSDYVLQVADEAFSAAIAPLVKPLT